MQRIIFVNVLFVDMHCCAYPRRTTQEVNKTIIIQLRAKIHRSTWIRTNSAYLQNPPA